MKKAVKRNSLALLLALALSVLDSCAPNSTEMENSPKLLEPPNAPETETSDSPETQTAPVETAELVRFDSKLGCLLTKVYAIGEIYITEQNGIVFEVEVSSYHQPPERQLALAYAVLDSLTF